MWTWAAAAGGAAVLALMAYGIWTYQSEKTATSAPAGATADAGRQYGVVEPTTAAVPIAQALAGNADGPVTLRGKVVDMGPTMGCWMVIDDGTGRITVQTDPMVYVEQSVRGKTIEATGQVTVVDGGMGFSGKRPALLAPGVATVS